MIVNVILALWAEEMSSANFDKSENCVQYLSSDQNAL